MPKPPKTLGLVEWFRTGEQARVERAIDHLQALGVTHLRTGVSWAEWSTPDGQDWYDWLLPTLAAKVHVLPCFHYTPPSLGIEPRSCAPPREPLAFAGFLECVLSRNGSFFAEVELWNEPNNLSDWDWRLDPQWECFATMISSAAEAAHRAGKRVVLGGMCPIDPSWLSRMHQLGVLDAIDVVGVHGFPGTWDVEWTDWASSLAKARAVLNEHGHHIPIWITESAFSTWRHDERGQIEALLQAVDAPAERVYWSALQDLDPTVAHRDGFHVDERHYHLGLVRADDTPKLAYRLWSSGGIDTLREATTWVRPRRRRHDPLVVITGGAGFIGTNLAERLLGAGYQVLVYDNLSRPGVEQNLQGLCKRHPGMQVHVADIRDKYRVERATRSARQIFHFAAQVAVTTSLVQPLVDFDVNATGTINLLESIRSRPDPPMLIYTSTNKVYGNLEDVTLRETAQRYEPLDPEARRYGVSERRALDFRSPYGCSKGTADQYVLDYARSFGVPAVVFRMSCIYGPHQCGNEDQGWVAHFVARALTGQPLVIYGDGRQVRDLLFVDDLVDAFMSVRDYIDMISGQAFNIGGGPSRATSLLELLELLEPIAGSRVKVGFEGWRTGDQRYYVSDTRRFSAATGWRPQVAVTDGVRRLANWLIESGRLVAAERLAS
jgi:CDP-paratose 2-epimerase